MDEKKDKISAKEINNLCMKLKENIYSMRKIETFLQKILEEKLILKDTTKLGKAKFEFGTLSYNNDSIVYSIYVRTDDLEENKFYRLFIPIVKNNIVIEFSTYPANFGKKYGIENFNIISDLLSDLFGIHIIPR